jgi:hypothetical protein
MDIDKYRQIIILSILYKSFWDELSEQTMENYLSQIPCELMEEIKTILEFPPV